MKLRIICLFITLSIIGIVRKGAAQSPIKIGPKLSYGGTSQVFKSPGLKSEVMNARFDFAVALHMEWNISEWASVITEPGFSKRGTVGACCARAPNAGISNGDMSADLTYITVPVMGRFSFIKGGWDPYLEVGPRADFLVYQRVTDNASERYKSIIHDYRHAVAGVSTGIGVEKEFRGGTLSLGLRLDWDLTDSYSGQYTSVWHQSSELYLSVGL